MSMALHPTGIQRLVLELHLKKLQPEPTPEMAAEAMVRATFKSDPPAPLK